MTERRGSGSSRSAPATPGTRPGTDFPHAIGAPATRALLAEGYTSLEQLTRVRESDLARLHGVGPKAIRILREALEASDRTFVEPGG
jgi:hypothetical protein